jgi:hypothetical protein
MERILPSIFQKIDTFFTDSLRIIICCGLCGHNPDWIHAMDEMRHSPKWIDIKHRLAIALHCRFYCCAYSNFISSLPSSPSSSFCLVSINYSHCSKGLLNWADSAMVRSLKHHHFTRFVTLYYSEPGIVRIFIFSPRLNISDSILRFLFRLVNASSSGDSLLYWRWWCEFEKTECRNTK